MDEAIASTSSAVQPAVGERWREAIKIEIGEASPGPEVLTMEVKGRDLVSGIPKTIEINSDEIRDASRSGNAIVDTVRQCLKNPARTGCRYRRQGNFLAGGGAGLRNLDLRCAR